MLVYRFSTLPDDSSSSKGGNLDVSFQFHLFLGSKEILFLQLAKDATLSLQPDRFRADYSCCTLRIWDFISRGKKKKKKATNENCKMK